MADVTEAVKTRLSAVAGVTSIVGSGTAARIYPSVLRQGGAYPAVRYQQIDGLRESAMGSDTGVVSATVQVDSYADTYAAARALANAVRAAMQRFRGTVSSVVIDDVFVASGPNDFYEEQVKKYRCQFDFTVWHRE